MRERKRKDEIKSNDKHDEILLFFFETTCAYTLSQIREAFLKGQIQDNFKLNQPSQ